MAKQLNNNTTVKNKSKNGKKNAGVENILTFNTINAFRDESYTIVTSVVDELLKDPQIRDRIRRHTYDILKLLVEKWAEKYKY